MSHDYHRRKFGALGLSNMALSVSEEMDNILKTRGLIERVMKMAERREVETQKEVTALVRNMACHSNLRPVLLDSGIMNILHSFQNRCVSLSRSLALPPSLSRSLSLTHSLALTTITTT